MAKTRAQKLKEHAAFIEWLKTVPPEKMSPAGKYMLAHPEPDSGVEFDMRAVLK